MRSAAEGAPRRLRSLTPLSLLARFASMAALGLMILLAPAFTQRWLRVLLTAALLVNGLAALSVSVYERRPGASARAALGHRFAGGGAGPRPFFRGCCSEA